MNFTPAYLATIQARTLIVQGDRDPFYPVEISVEMARGIPHSSLWIIPNSGHAPVFGGQLARIPKNRHRLPARLIVIYRVPHSSLKGAIFPGFISKGAHTPMLRVESCFL
jgi:hypothetical protein